MPFRPTAAARSAALATITVDSHGNPCGIPTDSMLEYVFGSMLPSRNTSFKTALKTLDDETDDLYTAKGLRCPSQNAHNNCHGRWSEALFAIFAWNTLADINNKSTDEFQYVYVKLPDRKDNDTYSTEWTSLLLKDECLLKLKEFILDDTHPAVKRSDHEQLLLIASNPDAVILRFKKEMMDSFHLPISVTDKITSFTKTDLKALDSLYEYFKDSVMPSSNLVALLSVKSSLRGDRRYQFVREGDNAKSILMYLYTMKADRELSTAYFANRFYCFSFESASRDDMKVMDAAMSAYVSSPIIDPIWAVDKLFECLKLSNVSSAIREIVKKASKVF